VPPTWHAAGCEAGVVTVLRLLTYNVRSLRDDHHAVTRVIREAEPHVACIQEAPRFLRWRSTCAALARRSGLVVVSGGRTAGANLILSSLSVDVISACDLTFSRDTRRHLRGTSIAVLTLRSHRFAVAGIHLDLVAEPRLRHVGELHAAIDQRVPPDVPAVVAGDVNDDPDSPVWRALAERGVDAWSVVGNGSGYTYSAQEPAKRIDAVFADRRLAVRSAQVLDGSDVRVASDHRPLLVELQLR
jgi:endonuclease/exonuclease/phosphatase family metal-dependent hydrolase